MGKIATRRTILGAALQLFTTRGFHDTSTARIAREAGVATGTLFHHFSSKAELVDALQRLIAGNRRRLLTEAVDPATAVADQVRALLLADVRWAVDHPDQDRFLRLCRLAPDLAPEARPDDPAETPAVLETMARGRESGALRDLPPAYLARSFLGLSAALSGQVRAEPPLLDDPAFMDEAVASVWGALRRPAVRAAHSAAG